MHRFWTSVPFGSPFSHHASFTTLREADRRHSHERQRCCTSDPATFPCKGLCLPAATPNRCIHGLRHAPSPLRRTGEAIPRRRQTSPLLNAMRQNRAPPPAGQPPSKGINCLRLFQQQPARDIVTDEDRQRSPHRETGKRMTGAVCMSGYRRGCVIAPMSTPWGVRCGQGFRVTPLTNERGAQRCAPRQILKQRAQLA